MHGEGEGTKNKEGNVYIWFELCSRSWGRLLIKQLFCSWSSAFCPVLVTSVFAPEISSSFSLTLKTTIQCTDYYSSWMMVTVQKLTLSSTEEASSDTSSPASSAALKSLSWCNCSRSLSTYQDKLIINLGSIIWRK